MLGVECVIGCFAVCIHPFLIPSLLPSVRSQLSREQLYRSLFLKLDRPRQKAGTGRRQSVKKKGFLDAKDVVKGVNANRKEIEALFGTQRTQRAIDVFNSLDATRCGRVSWAASSGSIRPTPALQKRP